MMKTEILKQANGVDIRQIPGGQQVEVVANGHDVVYSFTLAQDLYLNATVRVDGYALASDRFAFGSGIYVEASKFMGEAKAKAAGLDRAKAFKEEDAAARAAYELLLGAGA
jgi:hypothetical protein